MLYFGPRDHMNVNHSTCNKQPLSLVISQHMGATKHRTAPPHASRAPRQNTSLGFN